MAGRLAELAAEVTEPPVRLVKTIGDAAMFVSPEPGPLVAVALTLVEAVEAAELPSLRAGIASGRRCSGPATTTAHSVNLASRVTGVARPGSVLCTQEVRDAARRRLRLVVRRPPPAQGRAGADAACYRRAGRVPAASDGSRRRR